MAQRRRARAVLRTKADSGAPGEPACVPVFARLGQWTSDDWVSEPPRRMRTASAADWILGSQLRRDEGAL